MRPPLPGERFIDVHPKITLSAEVWKKLTRHAHRRDMSEGKLMALIIQTVLNDELVNAVIDDIEATS
jgi:hypothetical protein